MAEEFSVWQISIGRAVTRVMLPDLAEISGHFIYRENEDRIHEIEFNDGSHMRVVIEMGGTLKSLDGEGVQMTLQPDGCLILAPFKAAVAHPSSGGCA